LEVAEGGVDCGPHIGEEALVLRRHKVAVDPEHELAVQICSPRARLR
jgi:hypothetical protein